MQLPIELTRVLIAKANQVREFAYAPYSGFRVGACLLAPDGQMYAGANVENSSYGMTICAERSAIANAVSIGQAEFLVMALVTDGGHTPCGACRQVLAEFNPEMTILVVDVKSSLRTLHEFRLYDLLPNSGPTSGPGAGKRGRGRAGPVPGRGPGGRKPGGRAGPVGRAGPSGGL